MTTSMLLQSNFIPTPVALAVKLHQILKTRASDGAIFVQQLHYWICKRQGKVVNGVRWIYNTYAQWRQQFPWLGEWDFRVITSALRTHGLIKFDYLSEDRRDRTGYYTIDYNHEWLKHESSLICAHVSDAAVARSTDGLEVVIKCNRTETTSENSSKKTTNMPAVSSNFVGEEPTPKSLVSVAAHPSITGDEAKVVTEGNSSAAPISSKSANSRNLETEAILNTVDNAGIRVTNNSHLQATVLRYSLEQVQRAIAYYQHVKRFKEIANPPGWLTECLKGRWWEQAKVEKQYPDGFLEAYQQLITAGIVEDVPPSWLPTNMWGEPDVRVINQNATLGKCHYALMWWQDALALLEPSS